LKVLLLPVPAARDNIEGIEALASSDLPLNPTPRFYVGITTMQNYEIRGDLTEQRQNYLGIFLPVTAIIGLWILSLNAQGGILSFPPFACLFSCLALSFVLSRLKRIDLASWVYVLGLQGTFAIGLMQSGPSTTVAFLLLVPVVLASVLFDANGVIHVGVLSVGLMFGILTARENIVAAANFTFVPAFFCLILVAAIYVTVHNMTETVYWATDIQKKDTHRAEMFYAKSEELSEALRQLTHAHSRLELLNRKLEEAQRRAEQASKAKSIFLSNMSHELRTPLNVIIGYTSTMLDMPAMYENMVLPSLYRSDIQLIKENGYHLLGLINDILDLSKIEAGKLELHNESVGLPELFRGIIATSIGLAKDKPIQIRPDFPQDLPRVWADPMRVRQIILNLMSNAVKFTQTGSVTLQARVIDNKVQISVIDTGIGIPEKALAHIFDRFQQAENDTDKHFGGTGLGLDISRQLARMHGGDLSVTSRVGHGSTFSFTLSITDAQETAPETPAVKSVKLLAPAEAEANQIYTILLVEDEVSMRDMIRRTLEGAGHVVADVQDGADVIDAVTGLLPDLIILDVRLPNVNGWDILQSLKNNVETSAIPVIVSTANEDEDHAMQLGAELYLRKPFSSDELLACVEELLPTSLQAGKGNH
jgi:signal transduction histidine kinase/ActR/RegA family two-component response regulator